MALSSAATVKRAQANACILALDATSGVKLSGASEIESNCGLHSNGSSSNNFQLSGTSRIKTNANTGTGGASLSGAASLITAVQANAEFFPDPLGTLPEPPSQSGECRNISVGGVATATLAPGRYCQLSISGSADVRLEEGVHSFEGPLNIGGMGKLRGSKVLIHLANGGSFDMNGLGEMELRADTIGVYSGVTIFQSRSNTSTVNFSGGAAIKFDGVLYAPNARFTLSGAGGGKGSIQGEIAIIVRDVSLSGASKLHINRQIGSCGSSAVLPASVMTMCKGGSDVGVRLIR